MTTDRLITFLFAFYLGGMIATGVQALPLLYAELIGGWFFFLATLLWPIALVRGAVNQLSRIRFLHAKKTINVVRLSDIVEQPNSPEARKIIEEKTGVVFSACRYIVEPGDDLKALCREANVDLEVVTAMNLGEPSEYWQPGKEVQLPREIGLMIEERGEVGKTEPKA